MPRALRRVQQENGNSKPRAMAPLPYAVPKKPPRCSDAPAAADTDWKQILALYDQLLVCAPTPVVRLNRAVAVAEVAGPEEALDLVDRLPLDSFYLYHAIRADLLRRLGRAAEAALAYQAAIDRTQNAAERDFLTAQLR